MKSSSTRSVSRYPLWLMLPEKHFTISKLKDQGQSGRSLTMSYSMLQRQFSAQSPDPVVKRKTMEEHEQQLEG